MTLRFDSVSLKNFGPFRDVANLSLTTTDDAPVIVIHGENTLGKTSLFKALRWCLYGATEANKTAAESARGLLNYMNRPAMAAGENEMKVEMHFSAGGQKYQLSRTARIDGQNAPKVSVDLRIDASVIYKDSVEVEIGRLLHPQISEFFLFDGELLRDFYDRLNSDRERDLLRSSIESVLGIPALQLAARDIGVMRDDAMQRASKLLQNKEESEKARKRLRELTSSQESLLKDRAELRESVRKASTALEDVREEIASVEDLKADAREMESLESQVRGGEVEGQEVRDAMRQILAAGWRAPASSKLGDALRTTQARNDVAQTQQDSLQRAREQVAVLQKQIEGGHCPACDQALPPAEAVTSIKLIEAESELERLRSDAGDGPDLGLERRIGSLIDISTIPSFADKQNQLNKILSAQFDRSRRLATIKDRLKDNDAAGIRQLGNQQENLETAIESFELRLQRLVGDEAKINSEHMKLAGVLRRIGTDRPALAAESYFFEYVSSLISRTIDRYQERTRSEVEAASTAMFMKLIRDPESYEGIKIGRDYRVDLVGKHGPAMRTSEGGRQLIALSLIGALKRAAVRGGPVVLDSPLARLDLEHRENVLKTWIPELGNQAILLVQSGELTEEQSSTIMGARIGQSYRIFRPNNDPEEATIERTR